MATAAPLLVALDLDGTLLTEESLLPAGHGAAVRRLREAGVAVAIVTGRPLLTSRWVWVELGLETPMVCFNGGWVGIPGQPPLDQAVLTERQMREVIAAAAGSDATVCGYPDAGTWLMDRHFEHIDLWRRWYRADIGVAPERFADWRGPSHKAMVVADPALIPALQHSLEERLGGLLHVVRSQGDRIEIVPRGITKAWGLERLAAHLGIARGNVWAVGDADNDREMVQWAGHGCAMGHAPESLRRLARHLLPGIREEGLSGLPELVLGG